MILGGREMVEVLHGLGECVELPAGTYVVGEPGEERNVAIGRVLIGRWPVTNGQAKEFFVERPIAPALQAKLEAPALQDHPLTDVTLEDARAFCTHAGGRLPTADEWEAAARGTDQRQWPWGDTFDPERCACAESAPGWTVPVTTHPQGASPIGAEQLAGNVWEWTSDTQRDGWAIVKGGCHLDTAWGLRASRALAADPHRATPTTGFRLVFDPDTNGRRT